MVGFDLPFIVMDLAIGQFLYSFTHAIIPSMLGMCAFNVYLPDLSREFSLNLKPTLCFGNTPKRCLWTQLSSILLNLLIGMFSCVFVLFCFLDALSYHKML